MLNLYFDLLYIVCKDLDGGGVDPVEVPWTF